VTARIGVIDDGIDYTHADFGGPGTPAAYRAVDRARATPLFPTAKVVGGTDLVGDGYDAAGRTVPPIPFRIPTRWPAASTVRMWLARSAVSASTPMARPSPATTRT
jgi:hypothetical protein